MKIRFIEEEALLSLKSNLSSLYTKFAMPTSNWIEEYFGKTPFIETKYVCEDFILDMSQEKPFLTEFENVQRVYNRLNFLTPTIASDERLWVGLNLNYFWEYTLYRWRITENCTYQNVLNHFFFSESPRRSLTRNAIARLWWIGFLTYDTTAPNPYKLTSFVCENYEFARNILENNTANNKSITRAFINALISAREEGYLINSTTVAELTKYLNLLGGTYILDSLPETTIYNKILTKARMQRLQ